MDLGLSEMKAVALELNDVLGISPAIKTTGVKLPALQKKVEEAIALVDFEEDEFSAKTMKAFTTLGYDTGAEVEEEVVEDDDDDDEEEEVAPPKKKKKAPKVEVEEEEDDDEEEDTDLIYKVTEADLTTLKALIKEYDEFAGIRKGLALQKNVEKLRARALEVLGVTDEEEEEEEEEVVVPKKKSKKAPLKVVKDEDDDEEEEDEDEAPKKKAAPKKAAGGVRVTTIERVEYITPFIKEAKYTKKELLEKMCKKYATVTKAANQTILTDGKNPKYNKFAKLIVQNEDGIMSFSKKK